MSDMTYARDYYWKLEPEVREVLTHIDEVLAGRNRRASVQLNTLLAALRGPDSQRFPAQQQIDNIKDSRTGRIRAALFPRLFEKGILNSTLLYQQGVRTVRVTTAHAGLWKMVHPDVPGKDISPVYGNLDEEQKLVGHHYLSHATQAMALLGFDED